MSAHTADRIDLILAAQTGDAGSIERLLAVCQADARRYARRHCHVQSHDQQISCHLHPKRPNPLPCG